MPIVQSLHAYEAFVASPENESSELGSPSPSDLSTPQEPLEVSYGTFLHMCHENSIFEGRTDAREGKTPFKDVSISGRWLLDQVNRLSQNISVRNQEHHFEMIHLATMGIRHSDLNIQCVEMWKDRDQSWASFHVAPWQIRRQPRDVMKVIVGFAPGETIAYDFSRPSVEDMDPSRIPKRVVKGMIVNSIEVLGTDEKRLTAIGAEIIPRRAPRENRHLVTQVVTSSTPSEAPRNTRTSRRNQSANYDLQSIRKTHVDLIPNYTIQQISDWASHRLTALRLDWATQTAHRKAPAASELDDVSLHQVLTNNKLVQLYAESKLEAQKSSLSSLAFRQAGAGIKEFFDKLELIGKDLENTPGVHPRQIVDQTIGKLVNGDEKVQRLKPYIPNLNF